MEVHSFAAVSAENLILKQIDKSGPYFPGLAHFRPAGVRRSFHDCLNTVKSLAADDRLMSVTGNVPLVLACPLSFVHPGVDCFSCTANHKITAVRRVFQKSMNRAGRPAHGIDTLHTVYSLQGLRNGGMCFFQPVKNGCNRQALKFPLENISYIACGSLVRNNVRSAFIPFVAVWNFPPTKTAIFHLSTDRGRYFARNILGIKTVYHILKRYHQ